MRFCISQEKICAFFLSLFADEVQAIASLIEKQAQIVVKQKDVSENPKKAKEALLAQYANITDEEEYPFDVYILHCLDISMTLKHSINVFLPITVLFGYICNRFFNICTEDEEDEQSAVGIPSDKCILFTTYKILKFKMS